MIGIDIVQISKFKEKVKDPEFTRRIFSELELEDKLESMAGKFALKEAFFKATQIKIKKWNELVVKKDKSGKPYLIFDKDLLKSKIKSVECSISHDGDYAVAFVLLSI